MYVHHVSQAVWSVQVVELLALLVMESSAIHYQVEYALLLALLDSIMMELLVNLGIYLILLNSLLIIRN